MIPGVFLDYCRAVSTFVSLVMMLTLKRIGVSNVKLPIKSGPTACLSVAHMQVAQSEQQDSNTCVIARSRGVQDLLSDYPKHGSFGFLSGVNKLQHPSTELFGLGRHQHLLSIRQQNTFFCFS